VHALRNALVPTIVLAGLSLPTLIGGAVFVERIFSWPGLGSVAMDAFQGRDYQVVLGLTMLGAVVVVAGNLLADVLHAVADPRVREQ
jgi:peptide/nickel transport system permease protein